MSKENKKTVEEQMDENVKRVRRKYLIESTMATISFVMAIAASTVCIYKIIKSN